MYNLDVTHTNETLLNKSSSPLLGYGLPKKVDRNIPSLTQHYKK
jgi:hypothetical protein